MLRKKLRIAQLGSIWETTPPKLYGGTERVVSNLTEGLVKQGHEVTLFATGDSKTKAKLVSITPKALYRHGVSWGNFIYPLLHIYNAYEMSENFDLIHVHLNMISDFTAAAMSKLLKIPSVFTIHFKLPDKNEPPQNRYLAFKNFSDINYVSISNSQRIIKSLNYIATVYNGIDFSIYEFDEAGGDSLCWIGRFSPDKGPESAIKVSKKTNKKILLAGKIDLNDKRDQLFYRAEIEPYLKSNPRQYNYVGEINDKQKSTFFPKARCLLNPINWREPFGLVVVEANACGTPVVAFDQGAMREIIKDGVNGFVVGAGDIQAMTKRVEEIYKMPDKEYREFRRSAREYAEKNFSTEKMVANYEKLYYKILSNK